MSMTATIENDKTHDSPRTGPRTGWSDLESICVDRLTEAIGASPRVFNRQLRDGHWDRTHGTEDLTSTAISIIGLNRSGHDGIIYNDKERILSDTLALANRRQYGGGFGLLLWANSVFFELEFAQLVSASGLNIDLASNDLSKHIAEHVKSLTTMETAWLCSGLLHQLAQENDVRLAEVCNSVVASLESRFNPTSNLFWHADERASLDKRMRRGVPNFADQIYSVQALALAAMSDHSSSALDIACRAATRLTELQGPLGQWWWHYDARSGSTAQTYPVYSVHQHAMAPMALMTLNNAGGPDFRQAIDKSMAWIETNETNIDMVDTRVGTIWRDIQPPVNSMVATVTKLASVAGIGNATIRKDSKTPGAFVRNHETRPYEWGWCLFAQAIAEKRPKQRHII